MKTIELENVGEVTIRKSARAKRIILKINQTGKAIVTIPNYVPYLVGEKFARQHSQWFQDNAVISDTTIVSEGKEIGDLYIVRFNPSEVAKPSSRVAKETITVSYPENLSTRDPVVQKEAVKACTRALRTLAERTLPSFLHHLAQTYGYQYNQVRIKNVQTRWGSCSSNRIINLSVWLMQLPEPLIEYVLCHELAHLNNMNHSTAFWKELSTMIPDYKKRRQMLREYRPTLM